MPGLPRLTRSVSHMVNQPGDPPAKLRLDLFEGRPRVFSGVVKPCGDEQVLILNVEASQDGLNSGEVCLVGASP